MTDDAPQIDPVSDLLDVLDLQYLGPIQIDAFFEDTDEVAEVSQSQAEVFLGRSQPQPHGRVFGGQVLAQCIMAAGRTVGEINPGKPRFIHSLHGYFLRPGDSHKPLRFVVENLRDGGSFSARRIQVMQSNKPIMSMIMSFQEAAEGIDSQEEMPQVPAPESLPTTADVVGDIDHPIAQHWAHGRPVDVRHVEPPLYLEAAPQQTHQAIWMRTPKSLPDDPLLNAAVLAYASDYTLLEPAMRANGVWWSMPGYKAASLDHAMWFHRPVRMDDWVLYTAHSPSASGGRGLGVGRVFARNGDLVATVAQEGMMRAPLGDDAV